MEKTPNKVREASKLAQSPKIPKPEKKSELDLAIIPLKELVVFPRMIMPLLIARNGSVQALEDALINQNQIALLCQQTDLNSYPKASDLPQIGVLAQILQTVRMPDGGSRVMVECRERIFLQKYLRKREFLKGRFEILQEPKVKLQREQKILIQLMQKQFEHFMSLSQQQYPDTVEHVPDIREPGPLADMIAAYIQGSVQEKQQILEILHPIERLEFSGRLLSKSMELLTIENQLNNKLRQVVDKQQKEYFLREKIRLIREELGDENSSELEEYSIKIAQIPQAEVREKAQKELKRLEKMPPVSSEGAVSRNYLDLILELPWQKAPAPEIDLGLANQVLEAEHHGLEKIKDRILEYLAVRKLTQTTPQTLLCLVGPPGVGKTSLSQSIAHATGRKFERIALGGVGDDAEIRGHRRTYIGALPGRIIQAIRHAGTTHLVILLDEMDKMTKRMHGDPASALLEVLDPAQNKSFRDHFLELPFDLHEVLFICAANSTHSIPKPLLDRMQVLRLSSYTQEEKVIIARQYLLPRQRKENGVQGLGITLTQQAIHLLIQRYTREAGVRELERQIGHICRKIARKYVQQEPYIKRIDKLQHLQELLGPPKFALPEPDKKAEVGLVRGLAWTETGGSVLSIEVAPSAGKGLLVTTGQLGEVMKESMHLALAHIRHKAKELGVNSADLKKKDIHIHVPEGAIPKDGPSAGIAISTALVSALTGKPVSADVAMTGEVTLRGKVLPIGGLKEKALAAFRENIPQIIIPWDNQSDLEDIPKEVKEKLQFHPVKTLEQVLKLSLIENPAPH